MPQLRKTLSVVVLMLALQACGGPEDGPGADAASMTGSPAEAAAVTIDSPMETLRAADAAMAAAQGRATVSMQGEGISVEGEFAATPCGGPYMLGKGVVYQTDAEGWKITIATEERNAGDIALKQADGDNQVIATVSNADRHFVRKASLGGTFNIGEDFKRAEADLELGNLMGRDTLRLQASFDCG